jgi:hypothetical protein
VTALVSIWLGLTLGASAAAKTWRRRGAAAALATYGVQSTVRQAVVLWLLVAGELGVAAALVAGLDWALAAAAVLFTLFAATSSAALLAGRGGRPCACFGGSSRLGWTTPLCAAAPALLAAAAAFGWFPRAPSGYDRWLTFGLSLSVVAIAALAVAVLALAREVGVLRLSAGDARGALEIDSEGPELGEAQPWASAIEIGPRTLLRLAVFSSDGCPLCRAVAPAVEHVRGDPLIAVQSFDEYRDAGVWVAAAVPGSPYAVALDLDGVALAKGTFNGLGQLESVLATARRRERGLSLAA